MNHALSATIPPTAPSAAHLKAPHADTPAAAIDPAVDSSPALEDQLGPDDLERYRALAPAAVASAVCGLLSAAAFLDWWWAIVPFMGVLTGWYALRQIRAHPHELTGARAARFGFVASLLGLIGGVGFLSFTYATEVPDGHLRISYADLQPDERIPGQEIPPSARSLDGQRVFIKGYALAGRAKEGITKFVLVRDKGDCCFGGNPKLTERILVNLRPGKPLSYTDHLQKLTGVFRLELGQAVDVKGSVVYQLDDAELH